MIILTSIPVVISSLLMAAHLYRHGSMLLAVLCLLLPLMLLVKHRLVPWLLMAALLAFAAEWARTLTVFISIYAVHGQPTTRLSVIIGTVITLTLLSSLVFRTKTMKQRYYHSS